MASKKKSSNAQRKRKSKAAKPATYSPLEKLPTELFHMILKKLDLVAVMAIKYVSRTLHAKSAYEDGRPVIDLRSVCPQSSYWTSSYSVHVPTYRQVVIEVERKMVEQKSAIYLTCSGCGKLKDNSLEGFQDSQFWSYATNRRCIACNLGRRRSQAAYKVGKVYVICCNFCKKIKSTKTNKRKDGERGRICDDCSEKITQAHPEGYLAHVMQLKLRSEGRRWAEQFCREGEEGEDVEVDDDASGTDEEETDTSSEGDDD